MLDGITRVYLALCCGPGEAGGLGCGPQHAPGTDVAIAHCSAVRRRRRDQVGCPCCRQKQTHGGALVFSVDEKSQIQALDRTQPGLPLKRGRAGTMTNDYKRHGTTTVFVAPDVATGKIIGQCMRRHHQQEWLRFLRIIERNTPKTQDLQLIVDNYAPPKNAEVRAWLEKHPRFHMHFTPTSGSWLNQAERFFGRITRQRIRRGVFRSVDQLEAAIHQYLEHHNASPNPFTWTAAAVDIPEKAARG